jgi:hypothetical protein
MPDMANMIKIGSTFLNVDQITRVVDLYPRTKDNQLVVRFGEEATDVTLSGQDADDLRSWLNGVATNLQGPHDLDTAG